MSDTNPQIEKQLDKIAEICCQQIESGVTVSQSDEASVEALLKALLMSGYVHKEDRNLQVDIENRIKDRCREPSLHRGGEITSLTDQLQTRFNELKRWESRQPDDDSKPKTANISSATDA
jgi:hypothetical protein